MNSNNGGSIDPANSPEYQAWVNQGEYEAMTPFWSFLSIGEGQTLTSAAAILSIAWPRFERVGPLVLLQGNYDEDDLINFSLDSHSKEEIESELNHIHLVELVSTEELQTALASDVLEVLKETWAAKLKRDFPDQRFEVFTWMDEAPGLSFCETPADE